MKTRFAFAGFRHGHILDLLTGVEERADTEVIACCEEDAGARAELAAKGRVKITHDDFEKMLCDVECDVVAIGDYYARRGALAIAALHAGKHVLSDKPLCVSVAEFNEIEKLAAEKKRSVFLQLDSRGCGAFRTLREIIRASEIGEVATIRIDGQHPLLLGTRPGWYFEQGKHGGTINDIGVHTFDFVPWMTGFAWREVTVARCWNAKAREFPHFGDCAQFMATLANGAGVLADFSYLAPDKLGYELPHYWRITVHGTHGIAETHLFSKQVTIIRDSDASPEIRDAEANVAREYLGDFLAEISGNAKPGALSSADCLRATRLALEAQRLAD
jgi:predicted dehydrogenase